MKPAVLYARVSSREQQQEGYSIQTQLKTLHEYAKPERLRHLSKVYRDRIREGAGEAFFDEMVTYLKRYRSVRVVLAERVCTGTLKMPRQSRNWNPRAADREGWAVGKHLV